MPVHILHVLVPVVLIWEHFFTVEVLELLFVRVMWTLLLVSFPVSVYIKLFWAELALVPVLSQGVCLSDMLFKSLFGCEANITTIPHCSILSCLRGCISLICLSKACLVVKPTLSQSPILQWNFCLSTSEPESCRSWWASICFLVTNTFLQPGSVHLCFVCTAWNFLMCLPRPFSVVKSCLSRILDFSLNSFRAFVLILTLFFFLGVLSELLLLELVLSFLLLFFPCPCPSPCLCLFVLPFFLQVQGWNQLPFSWPVLVASPSVSNLLTPSSLNVYLHHITIWCCLHWNSKHKY